MPKSGHFTPDMNPNSQNQIWSHWEFEVEADPLKMPSVAKCRENASRFFRKGFKTATGRIRVFRHDVTHYIFQVQVEGVPAHDPEYKTYVKRKFIGDFMFKGFGYQSKLVGFDARILAGNQQGGKPADQLIAMPSFQTLLKGLSKDG